MVSVGETDKNLGKALKNWGAEFSPSFILENGTAGRCITHLEKKKVVIRMPSVPVTPEGHGVLGHEIFHAVFSLMEFAGIKLSAKSEEAFAYMVSYLTMEIYRKFYDFEK